MATPQALTAFIRASRPDFKSTADKAAFAVHAIVSVNGFSLCKVGEGVDEAVAQGAASLPSEEVDLRDWNRKANATTTTTTTSSSHGEGGTYSFLYLPETTTTTTTTTTASAGTQQRQQRPPLAPPLLLVKCLTLVVDASAPSAGGGPGPGAGAGGVLLVSLANVSSSSAGRPPVSLELQLDRFVPSFAPGALGYDHLDELILRVQEALGEVLEGGGEGKAMAAARATATAGTPAKTSSGQQGDAASGREQQQQRQQQQQQQQEEEQRQLRDPDPLLDEQYPPRFPGGGRPGWRPALGVGDTDLMPGGLYPPPGLGGLFGGGGGSGGLSAAGPRGLGGGMHVGPGNPIFADRLRHPPAGSPGFSSGMGGGPAVPGMRWDPIAPEGLQGWSPDDYTRAGRAQRGEGFNDIGRPPPGRGPDWDHMFG